MSRYTWGRPGRSGHAQTPSTGESELQKVVFASAILIAAASLALLFFPSQMKTSQRHHCQSLLSRCQAACWNTGSVDCQHYVESCGRSIPSQQDIEHCISSTELCEQGDQAQCEWLENESECRTILYGCD